LQKRPFELNLEENHSAEMEKELAEYLLFVETLYAFCHVRM
jgi:hypothetical protein